MSTTRQPGLRPRPRPRFLLRALVWALIGLLAWPPPAAQAQLLPLGSTLDRLLNPVEQIVGGLPIVGPILDPLLDPVLDTVSGLVRPPLPNEYKLDAALRLWSRAGAAPTQRVIVTTMPGQVGLVGALLQLVGGLLRLELRGLNALVADVTYGTLGVLTVDPRVTSIALDGRVLAIDGNLVAPLAPRDGAGDTSASLRATLGLPLATPAAAGVGIAVIDSGIAPSIDFSGRIWAFYDFTRGGIAAAPIDPYGHGTHVAGIIASSGASSSGAVYRGIGPSARLIGLRVLDARGAGQTSHVIQAIEFAIAQRRALGIDIINLSLGHPIYESAATDPLVRAVERAVDAGIVVITSAGNFGFNRETGRSGYAGITSPGNAPSAITVGALRSAGTVARGDDDAAPYSSRGPSWYDALAKPDLLAPGHAIVSNGAATSALYAAYPSVRAGTAHMRLNGTSMAAAASTGVVALVIEAHRAAHPFGPPLTPNAIKAILQYTATPLASPTFASGSSTSGSTASTAAPDALVHGAGALNAPAAVAVARGIDASRPVGTDWLSGAYTPASTYAGVPWPWAQQITWRDTRVGGFLLEFHRRAWTTAIDWGQPLAWDPDLLVGQNLVWDRTVDWAANIVWGGELVGMRGGNSATGDQTYTWGYVDRPSTTAWGNLAATPTGDQTFTWGYTDVPPPER